MNAKDKQGKTDREVPGKRSSLTLNEKGHPPNRENGL